MYVRTIANVLRAYRYPEDTFNMFPSVTCGAYVRCKYAAREPTAHTHIRHVRAQRPDKRTHPDAKCFAAPMLIYESTPFAKNSDSHTG